MMLTFESAKFVNPSLEIIAEALKKGLKANYQEVTVEIINCPNLREWNCPSEGISGNERIIDVGGEPYMHDKQFIGTEFDYAEIAKNIGSEKSYALGAGSGAMSCLEGHCGELIVNENLITNESTKTPAFIILYTLLFLGMLSFLIVVTLQFDYAISNNLNLLASSIAPASIAAGSFCGRLVTGYLADFIDRNKILFSVFLGQGLSVLILLNGNSLLHYSLFGFCFGFSYGGWIPIFPSLLKDFFGKKHVGQIFGVFGTGFSISAIIGPPLAGFLVDEFNTYNYGFYICIVACLVAAVLALLIKKPIKN